MHTPEPWIVIENDRIISQKDQLNNAFFIADCFGPDAAKNAMRLAACVNACASLSTEQLEGNCRDIGDWSNKMIIAGIDSGIEIESLQAQRDELLAALKKANEFITNGIDLGYIRMPDVDSNDSALKTPELIMTAIAKCEQK